MNLIHANGHRQWTVSQVTRLVRVELEKGDCEVVLKSLSKSLDKESIRVDGIGPASITEVSYQVRS